MNRTGKQQKTEHTVHQETVKIDRCYEINERSRPSREKVAENCEYHRCSQGQDHDTYGGLEPDKAEIDVCKYSGQANDKCEYFV